MRYMLLIYGCEGPESEPISEAKREAVRDYFELLAKRGVLIAGEPLRAPEKARTVRVREGEALVTDGPFAETVEQLGGYFLLDCEDDDEAMELASRCPMAAEGSVEVRPILDLPYAVRAR
ncbi:YciI family protein [Pseudonocardia acaciae]|uniref:YciI family protein n=1 Tax=Pseudonocardia acaciae TaxID=551276 RepID=UPI0004914789|nr:YciI family protein [Pseudonocardia acaciae]